MTSPTIAGAEDPHLFQTVDALTTLALCHHGQVVALVAAVEAMLAVMSKSRPGVAEQLQAHLRLAARDHRDARWDTDQSTAFDNQINRLRKLLELLRDGAPEPLPMPGS